MPDLGTFLTTVYVLVDDTIKLAPPAPKPGPQPELSQSEVVTVALLPSGSSSPVKGLCAFRSPPLATGLSRLARPLAD
jgi:hypothetical protein